MANKNLTAAKKAKNDEFYTQFPDIEKELCHYKPHFAGKVVFCNCDDPTWSNFWRYFHLNFAHLGLKKLIATHYDPNESTYKMEYEGGNDTNVEIGVKTPLLQNGDFRSEECIELLKEADIVVTNPPFSLFREYTAQLVKYGKKFVIIGNMNAITYKEFFPLMKDNKVWLGYMSPKTFMQPDGNEKKFGNVMWYTNLDIPKRHEPIDLIEHYSPEKYPKYDNYDAINVDKTLDIPKDYDGVMGVPISFLDKYCPEQFEIVGGSMDYEHTDCHITKNYVELGYKFYKHDRSPSKSGALRDKMSPKIPVKGKGDYSVSPSGLVLSAVYGRIFIRKK